MAAAGLPGINGSISHIDAVLHANINLPPGLV